MDKKDALAKSLYSGLFTWLVNSVNSTISANSRVIQSSSSSVPGSSKMIDENKVASFIGVLDIYGFEAFEINSFEQLLINFANEALQRQFNRYIFELEQTMYEEEGIDWSYVQFNDNRPCVELIDGVGVSNSLSSIAVKESSLAITNSKLGILQILDDCFGMPPHQADNSFLTKMHNGFATKGKEHEFYIKPRIGADKTFIVKHYPGEVMYQVDGFNEKNVENLHQSVKNLISSSTCPFVADLLAPAVGSNNDTAATSTGPPMSSNGPHITSTKKAATKMREASVGSQFRESLKGLIHLLDETKPIYIRCIKPNAFKRPTFFHSEEVLQQLRYAGMMEVIRIRQQGYSERESFDMFKKIYHCVYPDARTGKELVKYILDNLLDCSFIQMGPRKVFLKKEAAMWLTKYCNVRLQCAAKCLTTHIRDYSIRLAASKLIKPFMRMSRWRAPFLKRWKAMISINHFMLMLVIKLNRIKKIKGIIKLQSKWRGMQSRLSTNCDYFVRYSEEEEKVCNVITEEELQLEDAVKTQNYASCAGLQDSISKNKMRLEYIRRRMKNLLKKDEMEEKVKNLKKFISKNQSNDGERTEYIKKLELLLVKYTQVLFYMKTVTELKASITAFESKMKAMTENRDFLGCHSVEQECKIFMTRLNFLSKSDPSVSLGSSKEDGKNPSPKNATKEQNMKKLVSALAVSSPVLIADDRSIHEVSEIMKDSKVAAVKVCCRDSMSELKGIITDTDIARRVVAKGLDPSETLVSAIMTEKPISVCISDDASDALRVMVRGKFRHLPVLSDNSEEIVGILDIQKCLTDAINRLEKVEMKSAILQDNEKAKKKDRLNLESRLKRMGNKQGKSFSIPSLSQILKKLGQTRPRFVTPEDSSLRASKLMDDLKKGVMVVEDGKLVGVLSPSDIVRKVVAVDEDARDVLVDSIMTENPLSLTPDKTVLDALYTLRDDKISHLPVATEEGDAVGLLSIVELVQILGDLMGNGESGKDLADTLANDGWDSTSDKDTNMSSGTAGNNSLSLTRPPFFENSVKQISSSLFASTIKEVRKKKLRTIGKDETILDAVKVMSERKTDCLIVVDSAGTQNCCGIITDKDIVGRVVADFNRSSTTRVEDIMTTNIKTLSEDEEAVKALLMMIQGGYRHLPIVRKTCQDPFALLDVKLLVKNAIRYLRCQIKDLENNEEGEVAGGDEFDEGEGSGKHMHRKSPLNSRQMDKIVSLLSKKGQGKSSMNVASFPTLRDILDNQLHQRKSSTSLNVAQKDCLYEPLVVKSALNVRETAIRMHEEKKSAIVTEEGEFAGILTPWLIVTRLFQRSNSSIDLTAVSSLMDSNYPEISIDCNLLEAFIALDTTWNMKKESEAKDASNSISTHIAVVDEDNNVCALLETMDVLRELLRFEQDDTSILDNILSFGGDDQNLGDGFDNIGDKDSEYLEEEDYNEQEIFDRGQIRNEDTTFSYKFVDPFDTTKTLLHKISSSASSVQILKADILSTLNPSDDASELKDLQSIQIFYTDQDGDSIVLESTQALVDAISFAKSNSNQTLKLIVTLTSGETHGLGNQQSKIMEKQKIMLYGGIGVGLLATVSLVIIFAMKGQKKK